MNTSRKRAENRSRWPIRVFRLGREPSADLAAETTPEQRIDMVWLLTLESWSLAGRTLPEYKRAATPMNQDFLDVLGSLPRADTRFLVVGAHALAVHGVPRATGDLDVPFIGRETLIKNKQATGRLRDLADLEELG